MSGGTLVVLDRNGRAVKQFPLEAGLVTLGRAQACDIRILLPSVSPHHATVAVHANQTVVRDISGCATLVNGAPVSVAALRHNDVITIGERRLLWQYARPDVARPPALPALPRRRGAPPARPPRRSAAGERALQPLASHHRASMPASSSGKQVAIVQPQRRDTSEQNVSGPKSRSSQSPRGSPRSPGSRSPAGSPQNARSPGSPAGSPAPPPPTQASLWIESRKTTPRQTKTTLLRRAASAKKSTPLRLTALRRAHSATKHAPLEQNLIKIQAPTTIDHTKQAALMLMTGHTPKSLPSPKDKKRTPSLVVKKKSPIRRRSKKSRGSKSPKTRESDARRSGRNASRTSMSILANKSPLLPSARKSALKGPRSARKHESIKFDLSNLDLDPDDDLALHFSDTSTRSRTPSPRKSIHSRSSRMLESVGSPLSPRTDRSATLTPASPAPRKSLRGSVIMQKALENSTSDTTWDTTAESAFRTRTLTPRTSNQNLEGYSVVDLVSIDSSGVYDSVGSTRSSSIVFGTPQSRQRSTIEPKLLGSSTPYVGNVKTRRSNSNPNITRNSRSPNKSAAERRSKSLTTPENRPSVDVNSAKVSRLSRSRSRINDSDLLYISSRIENESPKSSRKSRGNKTNSSNNQTKRQSTRNLTEQSYSRISISSKNSTRNSTLSPVTSPSHYKSISNLSKSSVQKRQSSRNSTRVSDESRSSNRSKSNSVNDLTVSLTSPRNSRSTNSINQSKASSIGNITVVLDKSQGRRSKSNSRSNLTTSPLSPKSGPNSSRNSRSSRKNLTVNISIASTTDQDGTITPENRTSPEDVGTPVLSIQSLLDSSQNSLTSQGRKTKVSPNLKRKTIGVIRSTRKGRSSAKSKSLVVSRQSRKSNRSSRINDSVASDAEDNVTPKSSIKVQPEAVKNKHSTAKKPQSKRSLIDNLNESDIVKQLFNSPVKRKLSQSMTEISRKRLFDDEDDIVVRRPKRNTVAAVGITTPDDSLVDLNQTSVFTPDKFVSPLSTPGNSPNLAGIKRLFARNTPKNDLRDTRGVKNLLRTPRARRSIKNDLTNVSGVKKVFAKSPKNRLSDVRVKELFAKEPRNDLKRVSGVKALFQSQKEATVKNDLSNVSGVRLLFKRKSPENDLRRVSGVKRTFQKNSPKNDLTDVRGVRKLFKQQKQKETEDLNVSGVEELFNISSHSQNYESLFDQLLGKPTVKAVYSKSFTNKSAKKGAKSRKTKSFHIPVDITTNVEGWIQEELKKQLSKKHNSSTYITRELQKLATDTVEGNSPIRSSRTRDTLEKSGKKSASEVYSAHTLPIKKRSFVKASLEKSVDKSKHTLPIKKRAVLHSTPVKGRYNVTMNVSELSRVSPISLDKTRRVDNETTVRLTKGVIKPVKRTRAKKTTEIAPKVTSPRGRRNQSKLNAIDENQNKKTESPKKSGNKEDKSKESPKRKGRRGKANVSAKASGSNQTVEAVKTRRTRNTKQDSVKESPKGKKAAKKVDVSKVSPKKTRAAKNKSPTKTKTEAQTKRRSLVIKKKPPVLSPKPVKAQAKTNPSPKSESPKKRVLTRKQKTEVSVIKTPKTTRARATKTTVVVAKPSPMLKPQTKKAEKPAKAQKTVKADETVEEKTTRSTRGKAKVASPKAQKAKPQRGGKRKAEIVEVEPKRKSAKKSESPVKAKSKSKQAKNDDSLPAKRGRKTETKPETKKPEPKKPESKTRKTVSPKKTRGKSTEVKTRVTKVQFREPETEQRGRRTQDDARGRKKDAPKAAEKKGRDSSKAETGKRAALEPAKTTRAASKTTSAIEIPAPATSSRKRKTAPASPATQSPAKKARGRNTSPVKEPRASRSRRR